MRTLVMTGWMAVTGAALAASLDIGVGETRTVGPGEIYETAVVRNGGVLIVDGGAITTTPASVTVEPGGRFVFNNGFISDYVNRGLTELYGGTQSTVSSENRGQLILAGGDPGIQLVMMDGMLDLYSYATNRTLPELDFGSTGGSVRIWCRASSLPPNVYPFATMPTQTVFSFGKVSRLTNQLWYAGTVWTGRLDISMASNWLGTVKILTNAAPPAFTSAVRPAVEIAWSAASGRVYQVQYTTNLLGGVWRNLGLPVRAPGPAASACDSAAETGRTYRVLLRH